MVGRKCKIGVSLYPDFYGKEILKQKLDEVKELGYTEIFTSIQLGDIGFENTAGGVNDDFRFLFEYAYQQGMVAHVDVNDKLFYEVGCSIDNLKPFYDMHIPIVRLDAGFSIDEIAQMTLNPYGIKIEDNLSNLNQIKDKLEYIRDHGNLDNYCGLHNFFPRIGTGLSLEKALWSASLFNEYHCEAGIFIGSLYSKNDLNANGSSVPTIEKHRYLPAHIQISELLGYNVFDFIIFGDSDPRRDELINVSECNHMVKDVISDLQISLMHRVEYEYMKDMRVIDIPVYLEGLTEEQIKILETVVFVSRQDISEQSIRGTYTRKLIMLEPYNTIERSQYCITIDNNTSNRYSGELQIMMTNQNASRNINVVGYVKPYATCLLKQVHSATVAYRLVTK